MNRSVLIVNPDAFSMGWRGATPRTMDVAAGLVRHGWDVAMLTPRLSISVDHSALEIAFPGRIIQTPFGGAYFSWMDAHDFLRRANRGLWKLKGRANYNRAFQFGWALRTAQWARRTWHVHLPDVIWTISSSNLAGAVAGRYLSHVFARPMVMELRDPPIYPGGNPPPAEIQRGFARCVRKSAAIVTTTESYATYLRDEYSLPPEKVVPIYRSYRGELATPTAKEDRDSLVLLHAGSLTMSRGRNARTLLDALAWVFETHPACRGHVRLRLLGGGGGTAEFTRLAEQMNLSDALECLDEVPYDQFKRELDAADALLVIKYVEEQYEMQIPGKLFEYLGTGKPILGIMQDSTEAARILTKSGLGIVPECGNPEALGRGILELWNQRARLNEAYRADPEYVGRFSPENMARRVHELLSGLAARGELARGARPSPEVSVG